MSIVTFNVGGTKFCFNKNTILNNCSDDSYIVGLINGIIPNEKDKKGNFFLDKDPEIFGMIARYLRGYGFDLDKKTLAMVRRDAKFYGITNLVTDINEAPCMN